MNDPVAIFLISFAGGAIGGMLGVWLAWLRIRRDVLTRLGARIFPP